MEGLLQENGPFLWNYGTFKPIKNPWSWHHLTNVLYVDQPVGTGFSQGPPTERSNTDVANSFVKFFKNFVDTFGFQGKKIYIAGESYAGVYVPYIAKAMFAQNDTKYFDVQGTMIYDGSINVDKVMSDLPAIPYVREFNNLFRLNATSMEKIAQIDEKCGHTAFLNKWLTYPPSGKMPSPSMNKPVCGSTWRYLRKLAMETNACFNQYQITTTCPLLWDVLGFPGSFEYLPDGAQIYFDRADVKKAINAPTTQTWQECSDIPLSLFDKSEPSSFSVIPSVIEKSKRTIISHGTLDFILIANGSLLSIQNMTWNGAQGFQKKPSTPFVIPSLQTESLSTISGSGTQGIVHTERGLTWVEVFLSGHMVPQYTPGVAFRQLEFLLGRIPSMTKATPFTVQRNVTGVERVFKGFDGDGLDI
jgi:carboxypeptidase D